MKKRIAVWIALVPLLALHAMAQQTPAYMQAEGFALKGWHGNGHFALHEGYRELTVSMKKLPWEAFTLMAEQTQAVSKPVLHFKVQSDKDIRLRVDVHNGKNGSAPRLSEEFAISGSGDFQEVQINLPEVYEFGSPADVKSQTQNAIEQPFVLFYVNPGKPFTGDISIKDFYLGTAEALQQELPPPVYVFPNPSSTRINVDMPKGDFHTIALRDYAGKEVVHKPVLKGAKNLDFIDVRGLQKGVYLLQLIGTKSNYTTKISIQ